MDSNATTYSDEIGLIYVSDFMYGASPNSWSLSGYNYSGSDNWLVGVGWTISPGPTNKAHYVDTRVNLNFSGYSNFVTYVYPVFYLKPNVIYYDGTGSSGDPYRIALSE